MNDTIEAKLQAEREALRLSDERTCELGKQLEKSMANTKAIFARIAELERQASVAGKCYRNHEGTCFYMRPDEIQYVLIADGRLTTHCGGNFDGIPEIPIEQFRAAAGPILEKLTREIMGESTNDRIDKLQKFKDYVHIHKRLDFMGVPREIPDSPHTKEGCRVGGRLDWIERLLDDPVTDAAIKLAETVNETIGVFDGEDEDAALNSALGAYRSAKEKTPSMADKPNVPSDKPAAPAGYVLTGEYRAPKAGEWIISRDGNAIQTKMDWVEEPNWTDAKRHIIRPLPPAPPAMPTPEEVAEAWSRVESVKYLGDLISSERLRQLDCDIALLESRGMFDAAKVLREAKP
jgi:hypothetical protein